MTRRWLLTAHGMSLSEKYPPNTELGVSGWHALSADRLARFQAVLSAGDAEGRRRMLYLSLLPMLLNDLDLSEDFSVSINYGFDRIRFLPMPEPQRPVRARFVVLRISPRAGRNWTRTRVSFEARGDESPFMTADWLAAVSMDSSGSPW